MGQWNLCVLSFSSCKRENLLYNNSFLFKGPETALLNFLTPCCHRFCFLTCWVGRWRWLQPWHFWECIRTHSLTPGTTQSQLPVRKPCDHYVDCICDPHRILDGEDDVCVLRVQFIQGLGRAERWGSISKKRARRCMFDTCTSPKGPNLSIFTILHVNWQIHFAQEGDLLGLHSQ